MEELCQDCLENPIDRKRLKICNQCFNKRNNCKARGKEYIPKRLENDIEIEDTNDTEDIEGFEFVDIDLDKIEEAIELLSDALNNLSKMMRIAEEITQEILVISHKKEKTDGPDDPEYMTLAKREWNLLNYRRTLKNTIAFLQKLNPAILNDNLVDYTKRFKSNIETSEYKPKSVDTKTYTVSVNVAGLRGTVGIQLFRRTVYSNNEEGARAYVENFLKGLDNVTIYNNTWRIKEIVLNNDKKD